MKKKNWTGWNGEKKNTSDWIKCGDSTIATWNIKIVNETIKVKAVFYLCEF